MSINYKFKYLKYKNKYLQLKQNSNKINNMKGGIDDKEIHQFKKELFDIYRLVLGVNDTAYLTGSGALVYIAIRLELDLNNISIPNDLDFMYEGAEDTRSSIGNFIPSQITPQASRTWKIDPSKDIMASSRLIKSFDFTKNRSTFELPTFILIDSDSQHKPIKINILALNKIKSFYQDSLYENPEGTEEKIKAQKRIHLINEIEKKIKTNPSLLIEYGLDSNVTYISKRDSKLQALFNSDIDDEIVNSNNSSNLFSNTLSPPPSPGLNLPYLVDLLNVGSIGSFTSPPTTPRSNHQNINFNSPSPKKSKS
jgi:hypothetical protein